MINLIDEDTQRGMCLTSIVGVHRQLAVGGSATDKGHFRQPAPQAEFRLRLSEMNRQPKLQNVPLHDLRLIVW